MRDSVHTVEKAEVMASLDGELSVNEAAKAAAHLKQCSECQKLAAELSDFSQELTSWEIPAADTQMEPTVAAALDDRQRTSGSILPFSQQGWRRLLDLGPFPSLVLGIAGVGLLLLLLYAIVPTHPGPAGAQLVRRGNRDRLLSNTASDALAVDTHGGRLPLAPVTRGVVGGVPGEVPQGGTVGGVTGPAHQSQLLESAADSTPITNPMIARTAQLNLIAKDFDKARATLDLVLKRHQGYVAELTVGSPVGAERKLTATLYVPAEQLDTTLADLKSLGRVDSESQSGEEVTAQYVDLEARLTNARNTEKRLTDLLRQQSGKLADVLAVEVEIGRVRGEIERMEAERKLFTERVVYATLNATITEDYKARRQMVPPSIGILLHNAAIDGYQSLINGLITLLVFVMSWGPSLLLWGVPLFFLLRFGWRRWRRKATA